nr:glycosyltransferase [Endozoicomonas sp.]
MPVKNALEPGIGAAPYLISGKRVEAPSGGCIRKRKADRIEGVGLFDTKLKKMTKKAPGESIIPKIAHVIWLSGESAGSAPSERMLNIISLSKQLNAEGWYVKLWTNKSMVIERALSGVGLSGDSLYRGLQLETGTEFKCRTAGGKGIEICSDKNLFGVLESVNQKSYKNLCNYEESRSFKEACHYAEAFNKYDLPLLWAPKQAFNDQSEHNKERSVVFNHSSGSPDSGFTEDECRSSASGLENTCHFSKVSTGNKLTGSNPFKRSLLDHYLLHGVGKFNYSAKSDYLRMAALLKYGGVYIDSDTEASSVKDPAFRKNKIRFHTLSARHGILLGKGWDTDFSGDLIAAKPDAWQVRHMLMDQFYWSNQLDQLPYVLWVRNQKVGWCLRTIQITEKGLKVNPKEKEVGPYVPPGVGSKERLTLRDASRYKKCFYKSIRHSSPALQKGPDFDCPVLRIYEEKHSLRYLLTIHSPGPMTVYRMVDSYYRNKKCQIAFDNMTESHAFGIKDLKGRTVLSVTKWGELSRVATVSWDQPDVRPVKSFEDGEVLHLILSLPDRKSYGL